MLQEIIQRHIDEGAFPGAAVVVCQDGRVVEEAYAGTLTYESDRRVDRDTRYDLASVTKVYTSACIALLLERGLLSLDDCAVEYLPELKGTDKKDITILQLCAHTAGLFGDPELHKRLPDRNALFRQFFIEPLKTNPGEHVFYTSVGYQYLGLIIERVSGLQLSYFMRKYLFDPLHTPSLSFCPEDKENIAPTEFSVFRGRVCAGEVHDDNCYVLGGICGHAGLFGTAADVAALGNMLLTGLPVFHSQSSLRLLFTNETAGLEQNRSIAFIIDDPGMGRWDCPVFHHTGFTGTSLLLAPEKKLVCAMLTNRVCPTRNNEKIQLARLDVHQALARAWEGSL